MTVKEEQSPALSPIDITKASAYVKDLLSKSLPPEMAQVKAGRLEKDLTEARKLAKKLEIQEEEKIALQLGLIFTNVGYSVSLYQPFQHNFNLARKWLEKEGASPELISTVSDYLRVRTKEKAPDKLSEEVYQDIQNSIYSRKKYVKKHLPQLQVEDQLDRRNPLKADDWLKEHRKNLKEISYNTKAAKKKFAPGLKENIKRIKNLQKRKKKKIDIYQAPLDGSKSVQMMVKTSLRNHIDLTSIADNKANIMLSINAIIITIAMPLLIRYMGDNRWLILPMIILMITCVASVIFAALATRPIKMSGETDVNRVLENPQSNLFFFGNFFNLSLEDYRQGIKKVIRNSAAMEQSVINDLYFLGKALGTKFNLLRICYMIFMLGIALSVMAYGLVVYLTKM